MLGDVAGEIKAKLDAALKTAIWGAIAIAAGVAGGLFLLTALFIWIATHYDVTTACIVLGVIFIVISSVAVTGVILERRASARRASTQHERQVRASAWFLDPTMVATGVQIMRALGGRRSTMLLIGAVTLGWLLSRPATNPSNKKGEASRS